MSLNKFLSPSHSHRVPHACTLGAFSQTSGNWESQESHISGVYRNIFNKSHLCCFQHLKHSCFLVAAPRELWTWLKRCWDPDATFAQRRCFSVAFCSPAKSLTFSGLMGNPSWPKTKVLTSKQHAPKGLPARVPDSTPEPKERVRRQALPLCAVRQTQTTGQRAKRTRWVDFFLPETLGQEPFLVAK